MLEVVFRTFSKHSQQLSKSRPQKCSSIKNCGSVFLRLWFCCCSVALGWHIFFYVHHHPVIIYKNAVKSLLASHGTSQRQSGCQESAVDRGCGRTLRPLLGLVVVNVEGQLYNCEETCTFAEVERELNLTLLVGTTSFAKIHSSSRL